jgi:tripartite-type tricarboxylate transporter receptor subunit TctC
MSPAGQVKCERVIDLSTLYPEFVFMPWSFDMIGLFRAPARTLAAMLVTTVIGVPLAGAQEKYPSGPVKIVVPLPAGSSPDVLTRIVAEQLGDAWGQQVVVENRPGGGLLLGVQAALSAPADGYTLLAAPAGVFTMLPLQKDKLPFDVNRDLVPIGLASQQGFVIAVSSQLSIDTLAELIAMAKREPDRLVIGTNGVGTGPHLAAQRLVALSRAPMTVLPYATGGSGAAIADIMGGRVHAIIETLPGLKGALDAGNLKALAIMSSERPPDQPGLPTAAETVPGLTAVGWMALAAPKGTPEDVVRQLEQDLGEALITPKVRRRLEQIGSPARPLFSAELKRFIEAEQAAWAPMVKAVLAPK